MGRQTVQETDRLTEDTKRQETDRQKTQRDRRLIG